MNIYIDTEFNGFFGDLISIGCVSEDGKEFYECMTCQSPENWVSHHVIPVLGKRPVSRPVLVAKLHEYLDQFFDIRIIADWPEDLMHFCKLMMPRPGQMMSLEDRIEFRLDRSLNSLGSEIPHNALEDAKAIRAMALVRDTQRA